ncbi:MAG: LamG-like jellyroll fold domain-containing protein [Bacteroidota bacterium]|nr:LamG-like jellyroll fold domain-containing protein [Bacteroidota bacterium]
MIRSFIISLFLLGMTLTTTAQYADENASLVLGGSSYVSVPYKDALNIDLISAGQLSIDAWVRPTTGGTKMTIVGNDEATGYWFGMTAQRKLRFSPNPSLARESNGTIPLNTWTHVAASFDASSNTMVFYINGVVDATINTGQSYIGFSYFDLRIGADRLKTGPGMYWTGGIDEVRIWAAAMDFSKAAGLLYRIPLAMTRGLHGRYLKGGWRLNSNAKSVDGSADGSAVGGVSYAAKPDPPHYDRIALATNNGPDRSDHLTIPHRAALSLSAPYTLECWVRPSSGGNSQYQTFLTKGSYSKNLWHYWLGMDKSNNRVMFLPDGNWQTPTTSNAALPMNTWSHVAARFVQTGATYTATVFIDGVPAGSRSYTSTGSANTEALLIAAADTRTSGNTAYGYSGLIDEVRLWGIARSNDQIADHHRVEMSGGQTGMLARYPMDGDDHDRSGNSYHGTGEFRGVTAFFTDAATQPGPPTITLHRPIGGERWEIGATERIRWTATGLVNVRIELSRDGGQTFTEIPASSVPASPGQFDWTVSAPPTNSAIVRVRAPSSMQIADQGQSFQIEDPVPVLDVAPRQLIFTMFENGPAPSPQFIHIANAGGKTLSWTANRSSAMWYALAPESGTGNRDSIRVEITNTQLPIGTHSDNVIIGGNAVNAGILVNVVCNVVPAVSYELSGTVKTASGAPAGGVRMVVVGTMSAEAYTDSNGDYTVSGLIPGDYSIAPSSGFFDFSPSSRSFNSLSENKSGIDFEATRRSGDIVIRYKEGWNLMSLPIPVQENTVGAVFPDAVGNAYEYVPEEGYVEADSLWPGRGYWLKFAKEDSVVVTGSYETVLQMTLQDEYGGWNLIGGPCGAVPVAEIQENPSGALLAIYDYDPQAGYVQPPGGVLVPGRGYFAKVNVEAVLQLIAQSFAPGAFPVLEDALIFPRANLRFTPPPPPAE